MHSCIDGLLGCRCGAVLIDREDSDVEVSLHQSCAVKLCLECDGTFQIVHWCEVVQAACFMCSVVMLSAKSRR